MKMIINISEGELIPDYYRVSYSNVYSFSYCCAPIGIHLLVRLKRRLWEWSIRYHPSKFEKAMNRAFLDGKRELSGQLFHRGDNP